jgi:hypothetical protein
VKGLGLVLFAIVACSPPKEKADTTALPAMDTVKPAPPAAQLPAEGSAKAVTQTKSSAPTTKATRTSGRDSVLGRDSVIRFDLTDPRRTLGKPDTTKKKPPSRPL